MNGALKPQQEQLLIEGNEVSRLAGPARPSRPWVALIPEVDSLFGQLVVEDNLIFGAVDASRAERQRQLEKTYELVPDAVRSGCHCAAATSGSGD